ncbi:MAG: recombinase family protein [Planctomycetaceae bacterium]|jgi:DNA invertase Pin-like site-specific DNA recombinase|nr:recombinase family protein [Planctomycetaceae bacterium]
MATVYSYVRFSSKKQEQGDSVRRQIKLGNDWLAQNPQHTLDPSLRLHDLGVSAFRGANLDEKGSLGAFVALAKKPDSPIPKGAILLIERLDRFSRQQTRKAYRAFVELVEAGITVQTLDPPQTINEDNIDDLHVVLPLILQMTMAHEQSKEKSRRISAVWEAKREKARTGQPMFRKCPAWLRWDDEAERFAIRPKATAAIEFIFRNTANGRGQRHLVTDLNKRFTPFGKSGKWNASYIQKILNDRSVLGELQPYRFDASGARVKDGEPIANYYPRVVSDELFYAAATAKESRKRAKGRNTHFVNLFVGLLHGQDGHTLQVQTSRVKGKNKSPYVQRRLVSYGHLRGLSGACSYSLNYFHLEQAVLGVLYELDDSCLESPSTNREQVGDAEARVWAISRRMQELREALVSTSSAASSPQEIVRALEVLQQELQEAEGRLAEVRKTVEAEKTKPLSRTRELIQQLGKEGHADQQALRLKLRSLISTIVASVHVRMRKKKNRRVETDLMIVLRSGERRFVVEGRHLASEGDPRFSSEMADGLTGEWWADKKVLSRLTEVGFGSSGGGRHLNPPWPKSR